MPVTTSQEEYKTEGIVWKDIDYIDNTECLDLFAKKPTGLIYLLDEECRCALQHTSCLVLSVKIEIRNYVQSGESKPYFSIFGIGSHYNI